VRGRASSVVFSLPEAMEAPVIPTRALSVAFMLLTATAPLLALAPAVEACHFVRPITITGRDFSVTIVHDPGCPHSVPPLTCVYVSSRPFTTATCVNPVLATP
jgi:hypothetical protein